MTVAPPPRVPPMLALLIALLTLAGGCGTGAGKDSSPGSTTAKRSGWKVTHEGSVTTSDDRYIVNLTVKRGVLAGYSGAWKVRLGEEFVLTLYSDRDDVLEAPDLEYSQKIKRATSMAVNVVPVRPGRYEFLLSKQSIHLGTLVVEGPGGAAGAGDAEDADAEDADGEPEPVSGS